MKGFALAGFLWAAGLQADAVQNYPPAYADTVMRAKQEKQLVIYGVMHADAAVADLLWHFKRHYPFIDIHNSDGDGARTYRRFISEVAKDEPSADFIWRPRPLQRSSMPTLCKSTKLAASRGITISLRSMYTVTTCAS